MGSDFFVSYTSRDRAWAEWIGWVLEDGGATVTLQAWDFAPGSNFVLEMQRAAVGARQTIAVLSPDYLASAFAAPEWAAAFAQDPGGIEHSLIPIRVRECRPDGLLRAIVYIDLVDLDEASARNRLNAGISAKRGKPSRMPDFPGKKTSTHPHPTFPGHRVAGSAPVQQIPAVYVPKIRGAITDLDRTRFTKEAFGTIQQYFETAVTQLSQQSGVDAEVTVISAQKFTVAVFIHGQRKAQCKIWLGGMFSSNQISYYEGHDSHSDTAMNEALTLADNGRELALSAMMNMGLGMRQAPSTLDPSRLSADEAAEYLWRRFLWQLE